jgi:NAD(P)-dependent dehydrogenase (short-subunit alcohol dehydrogenase family)
MAARPPRHGSGSPVSISARRTAASSIGPREGIVDIVVTSAGFIEHARIKHATLENFEKPFGINPRGVFFTVQKALKLMNSGGSIILVLSNQHMKGLPVHGTYSAFKAALRSFARTWAMELKDQGIRVNNLNPGAADILTIGGQFEGLHRTSI